MTGGVGRAARALCAVLAVGVAGGCNVVEGVVDTVDRNCSDIPEANVTIAVGFGALIPDPVTRTQGETICWESSDLEDHPLEFGPQPYGGTVLPGSPLVNTLTATGTFGYHCIAHEADGEIGTIVVEP